MKRDLILHLPVIHRGYIDFFKSNKKNIATIHLICNSFFNKLSEFKTDIASLKPEIAKGLLESIGFSDVDIVSETNIHRLKKRPLILINDEVSRKLHEKYLLKNDIKWSSVFLRWDKKSVLSTNSIKSHVSKKFFDQKMMKRAYQQSKNSSDIWRQVGAVVVMSGKELVNAYNQALPNDHSPYQKGAVRDFLNVGERPDLSNTIHAEQKIIAEASKIGFKLKGSHLYVTHFPCSVCARLIAFSGIKKCYYGEGSSNLDGELILKSANVEIIHVPIRNRI